VKTPREPASIGEENTTLERPRVDRTVKTAVFTLRVAKGPDLGKELRIDASLVSRAHVGQSKACELRLADRMASRRHAALEISGLRLQITDLDSTNGTRINGVTVACAYLDGGERIEIGETILTVERGAAMTVSLPRETSFGRLVGTSAEMRKLYPICARLAASDVPVVIEGETGTGKELLAEALHETGPRAKGPFVVFDCTALPPSLLESALFGHERGAFTGANEARIGVFEQADGGTLLIDEIGDLDVALQAKLLRAIERSEIQRLGSNRWARVDVRIIAATRRDLEHEIQQGRFRDDLFFRLAVARIELPPLRKRQGDVTLLARHFWNLLGGSSAPLEDAFLVRLEDYAWPGNVRELHNTIARRRVFGQNTEIGLSPNAPLSPATGADPIEEILARELPLPQARQLLSDELERRYVRRILARHGGNVTRAAAASGLALRYFKLLRARSK
jgi:transcriptional regulator with GAF, ATPase, and Fis domain